MNTEYGAGRSRSMSAQQKECLQMKFKNFGLGAVLAVATFASTLLVPPLFAAAPSALVVTQPAVSPTYRAAITGLVPAASATDVFTVYGSATKTIGIKKVCISGRATAAANMDVQLIARTAVNTSGTSTAPSIVKADSTDGAATATVLAYTVNPTTGAGTLFDSEQVSIGNLTTGLPGMGPQCYTWHDIPGMKSPILRGVAQGFAINLNAATYSGGLLDITVYWVEN